MAAARAQPVHLRGPRSSRSGCSHGRCVDEAASRRRRLLFLGLVAAAVRPRRARLALGDRLRLTGRRQTAGTVRTTTSPSPSWAPSTNQVLPLPASTGVWPVASPRRSRKAASSGATSRAAGSRSLGPSAVRPAEVVPGGVDVGRRAVDRRGEQGEGERLERERLEHLPDAGDARPAAGQAEGHVGAEPRRRRRGR